MGRLEKIIISIIAIILVILIGLFILQRLPSLRQSAAYRVSVFIEDARDDQLSSIWHGMEKSASDHNIDIKLIHITDRDTSAIDREIENNVDAIVVSTYPQGAITEWLNTNVVNIPVISLDQATQANNITAHIGAKEEVIGGVLGKQVSENDLSNKGVIIVTSRLYENRVRFIALYNYLAASNINYSIVSIFDLAKMNTILSEYETWLLVSADNSVTASLCDFIYTSEINFRIIAYDYTEKTLSFLESGEILSLVVQSQYVLGYAAIEKTVAVIRGERINDHSLDLFVATKENMYGEMSSILFPVY